MAQAPTCWVMGATGFRDPQEGGTLPTSDCFLNLQILTCGGFAMSGDTLHH